MENDCILICYRWRPPWYHAIKTNNSFRLAAQVVSTGPAEVRPLAPERTYHTSLFELRKKPSKSHVNIQNIQIKTGDYLEFWLHGEENSVNW